MSNFSIGSRSPDFDIYCATVDKVKGEIGPAASFAGMTVGVWGTARMVCERTRKASRRENRIILKPSLFKEPNRRILINNFGRNAPFPVGLTFHGLQDATIGFEEALAKYQEERAARKKKLQEMIFGIIE